MTDFLTVKCPKCGDERLVGGETAFDEKEREIQESGPKVTTIFKISGKFNRFRDIPKALGIAVSGLVHVLKIKGRNQEKAKKEADKKRTSLPYY